MSGPRCVIVMGVSGSGKTTLARGIAAHLGWRFQEGDDLHPRANVEKMSRGEPLTDADRWPWLEAVGSWLDARAEAGESAVLTCSALRRVYRDLLCEGRPQVRFCHVKAEPALIGDRLNVRQGHYMPASLLPSQLATLEPLQPDEPGVVIPATGTPQEVQSRAMSALGLHTTGAAL